MDFQHFSHLLQWECSRTEEGLHFRPSTIQSSSAKNHTYTSDTGYSLNDGAIFNYMSKETAANSRFLQSIPKPDIHSSEIPDKSAPICSTPDWKHTTPTVEIQRLWKRKAICFANSGKRSLERKVHRLPLYPKDSLFTQRSPEEGH